MVLRALRRLRRVSPEARKAGLAGFMGTTVAAAVIGLGALADSPAPAPRDAVDVQILGVNDFHGRLESPVSRAREPGGPPIALGGVATLAAHLDRAQASAPGRTIRVHAGDMVGASPLLSSHFHDEPSVRAMNLLRFDVGTLGNHEFDEGGDELLRLLDGGQRDDGRQFKPDATGAQVDTSAPDFEGVDFPYVVANTIDSEHRMHLPPSTVIQRGGVKVGFIGVTTPTTPQYLLRRYGDRFRWTDMSDAVNREAAKLERSGVHAIVVLAHSGASDDGGRARGEIVGEMRQMSSAVDVVIAGHTHTHLNDRIPNASGGGDKLLVQANSFGIAFDRIDLRIDRKTDEVLDKRATTPETWADQVTPEPREAALVARYRRALGDLDDVVVGHARRELHRGPGEGTDRIGTLVANGQRRFAHADVAFVNDGNSRADIDAGPITYGNLFEASAYEHPVVRMRMTGAGIRAVLAGQLSPEPAVPLHVAGLTYAQRDGRIGKVALTGGEALRNNRVYTVAANQLLVEQRRFAAFRRFGRAPHEVGSDLEALSAEVRRLGSVG